MTAWRGWMLVLALGLGPGAAGAQTAADAVVQQLRQQGYVGFTVSRTLLGRVQVIAEAPDGTHREIVFNPSTGEILRDYIEDADGTPTPRVLDREEDDRDDRDDDRSGSGGGGRDGDSDGDDSGGDDSGGDDSGGDDSGGDDSGGGDDGRDDEGGSGDNSGSGGGGDDDDDDSDSGGGGSSDDGGDDGSGGED